MGPRSVDRGTQALARQDDVERFASMGPRSVDRGTLSGLLKTADALQLQWGRDLLIAELHEMTVEESIAYALQWGRDLLIAELVRLIASTTGAGIASMGPRSVDRG